MIKIAHEAPISILEKVAELTDYSYALVHLFEEYPEYYKFFEIQLKNGRRVILDNSIFELGVAFNSNEFAYWIERLQPTEYIIPDVLEDAGQTVDSAARWMQDFKNIPGKKIGVVQGRDFAEIVYCYKQLDKLGVDKIAISFDYSYYLRSLNNSRDFNQKIPDQVKLAGWCIGRIDLLQRMVTENIINFNKPHHLLGCSLPQEFAYYKGEHWNWIETLDTSNPVVAGLQGISYDKFGGLSGKPSIKLFQLINADPIESDLVEIEWNIRKFREIVCS